MWKTNFLAQMLQKQNSGKFTGLIPTYLIEKRFTLSSGPGGQNVQKNATKAEIRFKVDKADWIPEELRQPLKEAMANRINQKGELIIDSEKTRDRDKNLVDCFEKLRSAIFEVERKQSFRIETDKDRSILKKKAEKAAEHRLAEKRRLSQKKVFRSNSEQ